MKKGHYYYNYFGGYTKPSLVICAKNLKRKWFVQFGWLDRETNIKKRIQIKHDINKWTTLKDRLQSGNDYAFYVLDKLKRDWNPITNEFHQSKNQCIIISNHIQPFITFYYLYSKFLTE